jgi:conjugal transfer/type IV secretion protein DotA/TraY
MSDARESNRIKGTSVAAFMFMPQFRMCFQGFSHIYPVFMRVLALMFVQAKLLPDDHPALNYGAQGVPNTQIRDLFGEAWFTLRTTRATTFQYGMFGGIIMMMVTLAAAIGTFFARIFFGLGEVAQAQIFSHPGDPYGTGLTDISGGTAGITGAAGLFDSRVNGSGISTDYALMVLDKILRQAATGVPGNGGALQNALAGLMQVYNSGVLLVAGAMLFWMVLSIIVDSAKTGLFGGGRHNMVWTPIRVVFALGIMIPLGNQGFSSGQYAVMKLAEWGSNFGSTGWLTYVNGVVGDQSLLSPFSAANATSLVAGINKVMVCQVAFNTYLQQSTGAMDPRQVIRIKQDLTNRTGWVTNRYTNDTDPNVCGTITYGTSANAGTEDVDMMLANATATTPMDAASTAAANANRATYTNYKATMATAVAGFRNKMMGALQNQLNETSLNGVTGSGGPIIQTARAFACDFVARRYGNPGTPNNPVGLMTGGYNNCAAMATPANDPNAAQPQQELDALMQAINQVYDGGVAPDGAAGSAKADLMGYIRGGDMMNEMRQRGWAGMGMWYQDIASLNGLLQSAREPTATVEPGTLWEGAGKGGFWSSVWNTMKCAGRKLFGRACKNPDIEEKVVGVMADYDRWWADASRPGSAGRTDYGTAQRTSDLNPSSGGGGFWSMISFLKNLATGDLSIADWIISKIWPRAGDMFLFKAVDLAATNTYPLASLADTGYSIIGTATTIMVLLTVLQILSSAEIATFSGGGGLAVSALANGLATIAMTMMVAGVMIAFYLPVLPFLRVAFAVLTWMTSVFEAVVMVPIAALAHLTSEGDGLAGGARTAWILWLNVLMRPILVVFGFVAGMLIFNTFAVYFHTTFSQGSAAVLASNGNPIMMILGQVAYSVIYLGTLYTAANTSFKLMDMFPSALMRWMGGSPDHSMDDHNDGMMLAGTQLLGQMKPSFNLKSNGPGPKKTGVTQA